MTKVVRSSFRLHLTNVVGTGASQLLLSLLPALESDPLVTVEYIDLPDRGELRNYRSASPSTVASVYRRFLPNALSRIIECVLIARKFEGNYHLLVMGDLPLLCKGPQTLFVQTPHLIKPVNPQFTSRTFKYIISRIVFRCCVGRVNNIVVQTDVMRRELERSYPKVIGKVHVVPQPVPCWLLDSGLKRTEQIQPATRGLRLIYPSAYYPHKNHVLLSRLDSKTAWPVESLVLTLDGAANPAPRLPWVDCRGHLSSDEMIKAYSVVDALLFLSKEESYGFPLIEAMFVGLPIVCPDLPYARTLCGDQAIYFDPDSPDSLLGALNTLKSQLDQGWWPRWKSQLEFIPKSWDVVARRFIDITLDEKKGVV